MELAQFATRGHSPPRQLIIWIRTDGRVTLQGILFQGANLSYHRFLIFVLHFVLDELLI